MLPVRQPPAPARTREAARPPGPRGAQAAKVLAQFAAGRPLQACTRLAARYGDTVYLPVRPWEGLCIFSRPGQAEHVLASGQDNYVKPFTCRPLGMPLGDGPLTAGEATAGHRRPRRRGRWLAMPWRSYRAACAGRWSLMLRGWESSPVLVRSSGWAGPRV